MPRKYSKKVKQVRRPRSRSRSLKKGRKRVRSRSRSRSRSRLSKRKKGGFKLCSGGRYLLKSSYLQGWDLVRSWTKTKYGIGKAHASDDIDIDKYKNLNWHKGTKPGGQMQIWSRELYNILCPPTKKQCNTYYKGTEGPLSDGGIGTCYYMSANDFKNARFETVEDRKAEEERMRQEQNLKVQKAERAKQNEERKKAREKTIKEIRDRLAQPYYTPDPTKPTPTEPKSHSFFSRFRKSK
jgi:hypothetical protein